MVQCVVHHLREVTLAGAQGSRWSHGGVCTKRRETNVHFLPFIQSGTPAHGMMSPTLRVALPSCLTFLEMHSQTYLEMCFHGDYKYKQVGTEALVGISVSTDSSAPCFSPIPFYDLIPADDSAVFQGTSPNSPWTLLTQLITKSLISMDKYGLNCSPLLTTLGQIAARS